MYRRHISKKTMTFEALLVHHAPGFVVISILNSMYQVAVFLLTTFNIFQIKDHGNAQLGRGSCEVES